MSVLPYDQAERNDRERAFHDDWSEVIDPATVLVDETFSACTSPEPQWIWRRMGDVRGKRLLELGSGAGEGAVFFAKQGASVVATDISPKMLELVKNVARHHGVSVETQTCSADDLSVLPAASFDFVYAANLLHHVDIEQCLDQVKRVLKPGGMAAFWDPVAHNPVINIYRRMASGVRTIDEHPIRYSQFGWFRARFPRVEVRFFWLSALLIFVKFYLIDRVHPNEDRYWKRILTHEAELRAWYKPLAFLDRIVLGVMPILGWMCWNIGIVVWKEEE
ncbi:MAG: class I SAM-dependent methyltransferase [Magnetococcales bacterium]|nr:class I SAM-dependent methyltransferase [Magnetococcales bacterium]MBF0148985.1 class I SAM-dependent methyltransferase [Magnetococcales bacterium]MBF0603051.1 class I SAM-dependent methyltransferase [Magnetococcales bacterium]